MKYVAVAGTFNVLHDGHKALLRKTMEFDMPALVQVTSSKFAVQSRGCVRPYNDRLSDVIDFCCTEFPNKAMIFLPIEEEFNALLADMVHTLVVSDETLDKAIKACKGHPIEIVSIETVKNYKGTKISAREILSGEYDIHGKEVE